MTRQRVRIEVSTHCVRRTPMLLLVALLTVIGVERVSMQAPTRDPRAPVAEGTGVIRGRVIALDTGAPFPGATVAAMGGPNRPRIVETGPDGRYAFRDLPPGQYRISASPRAHRVDYIGASYGSTSQFSGGKPIHLPADGTVENVDIALPRAGVIFGRVTDGAGQPAARVQVSTQLVRPGGEPVSFGQSATTDDLGGFRLFGLSPGTYVVRAELQNHMVSAAGIGSDVRVGFMPTFAPGVPSSTLAERFRVEGGREVAADIRMVESRLFRVSGRITTSGGGAAARASVSIVFVSPGSSFSFGTDVGPDGAFAFNAIPPGTYEIAARLSRQRPGGGPPMASDLLESGSVLVDVTSADVMDVHLTTVPGTTVTGEIVFEGAAPPGGTPSIHVQPAERRQTGGYVRAEVDGTAFVLRDLFGPVLLRGGVSGAKPPWIMKAVLLDGRDVTDTPVTFTSGHGRLQILFTTQAAVIEGTVSDESNRPDEAVSVVVFPADEDLWLPYSSRIHATGLADQRSKFSVRGLREGRYLVAAVRTEPTLGIAIMTPNAPDRQFLRWLKKAATEVVLNAGETRTVDLRVVPLDDRRRP